MRFNFEISDAEHEELKVVSNKLSAYHNRFISMGKVINMAMDMFKRVYISDVIDYKLNGK